MVRLRYWGHPKPGLPENGLRCCAVCQFFTHCAKVKCARSHSWKFNTSDQPCTGGCPSIDCYNKGHLLTPTSRRRPRSHTDLRLTNNASKTITEATKAASFLCQVAWKVVFHSEELAFSPPVPNGGVGWTAPPAGARAGAAHVDHTLTDTASLDSAMPEAIRSIKNNSNCARPKEVPAATPRQTANPDSDITLLASSG